MLFSSSSSSYMLLSTVTHACCCRWHRRHAYEPGGEWTQELVQQALPCWIILPLLYECPEKQPAAMLLPALVVMVACFSLAAAAMLHAIEQALCLPPSFSFFLPLFSLLNTIKFLLFPSYLKACSPILIWDTYIRAMLHTAIMAATCHAMLCHTEGFGAPLMLNRESHAYPYSPSFFIDIQAMPGKVKGMYGC